MIGRSSISVLLLATPAVGLDLPEGATLAAQSMEPLASLSLPIAPWTAGAQNVVSRDGTLTREAWRLSNTSLTPAQIITLLREALAADGLEILFECADSKCGGFDFRYSLDLLPEPDMHVDLGNFRYLAAADDDGLVGLVVSRGGNAGYIHIAKVGETEVELPAGSLQPAPSAEESKSESEPAQPPRPLTSTSPTVPRLLDDGRAVLADLAFATGSAALEDRVFPSLIELAAWLNDTPTARVVLVGHSDAEGSLEANVALSRARAQAVVTRLVEAHNVARGQMRAEGIGFLAPLAANDTPEGRALNRRVEVIRADTN